MSNGIAELGIEEKDLGIKTESPKRPGGPLRQKPISINGTDYHPLYPPKAYKNPEGSDVYRGGKELISSGVVMNETARRAWKLAVSENILLADIQIENLAPAFEQQNPKTGARYVHPETPGDPQRILLPREWERAFKFPRTAEGRPILELIASKIGVRPEEVSDDMLATFVLFHEAGHAQNDKGKTKQQHDQERDLEIGTLPARNSSEFFSKFPNATQTELQQFLTSYRNLPSEVIADNFAATFIRQHVNLFIKLGRGS